MIRDVQVPTYLQHGITYSPKGFPASGVYLFSADLETQNAKPILLQLYDGRNIELFRVSEETILSTFLSYFKKRIKRGCFVVYFHYLRHDLPFLLNAYHQYMQQFTEFSLEFEGGITGEFYYGKVCFGKIRFGHTVLYLMDSFYFYRRSLRCIAQALRLPHQKMESPEDLGRDDFRSGSSLLYAATDTLVEYDLAKHILDLHIQYDVPLSVSLPQFCQRIFRKHCLLPEDKIFTAREEEQKFAELSYHGGKNGLYVEPGEYQDVTEVDIISAYPWAMYTLPNPNRMQYEFVAEYEPQAEGIYMIDGETNGCPYPCFLKHGGEVQDGPFQNLCVTSYELREGLRTGCISLRRCRGGILCRSSYSAPNPFRKYVDYFFARKENSDKDHPLYNFYKLALNSLYGKFVQTTEVYYQSGNDIIHEFRAGGMYQPFLASLITGKVRAYLHHLECRYRAIHSSTDAIKTQVAPQDIQLRSGLGGLKIEVSGRCWIGRNKLYLHYNEEGDLAKYALHGFHGSPEELERMVAEGRRTYTATRMLQLREAKIRGLRPFEIREIPMRCFWGYSAAEQAQADEAQRERFLADARRGRGFRGYSHRSHCRVCGQFLRHLDREVCESCLDRAGETVLQS